MEAARPGSFNSRIIPAVMGKVKKKLIYSSASRAQAVEIGEKEWLFCKISSKHT